MASQARRPPTVTLQCVTRHELVKSEEKSMPYPAGKKNLKDFRVRTSRNLLELNPASLNKKWV
jgi:hypothetical protein